MSKTIVKKRTRQKEVDPKFGVSEWNPAELDVRHTRLGTYDSRPLLEEELGESKLKRKHINLDKNKGKKSPLSLYPLIPQQTLWIRMKHRKLIGI